MITLFFTSLCAQLKPQNEFNRRAWLYTAKFVYITVEIISVIVFLSTADRHTYV